MAKQISEKCAGHAHPEPTLDQREEFHARLYDAIQSVDKAWGYANRTPAFHDLTERIAEVMNDLEAVKRAV